jgi:predicted adenine nucleotide alpha hydrolase (AANH) superfamily ATPase
MSQPKKPKLLLHICCAPCSSYVFPELQKKDFEVTGYFYNPNIHPYKEFEKRLETLKIYASLSKLPVIYNEAYDLEDHLRMTMGKGAAGRCLECYKLRLYVVAAHARAKGFDYFSTTLLISPHQNHAALVRAGMEISRLHGVPFYYEDLRRGFQASHQLAREMKLYFQNYCGCVFSEKERFARTNQNSYTA